MPLWKYGNVSRDNRVVFLSDPVFQRTPPPGEESRGRTRGKAVCEWLLERLKVFFWLNDPLATSEYGSQHGSTSLCPSIPSLAFSFLPRPLVLSPDLFTGRFLRRCFWLFPPAGSTILAFQRASFFSLSMAMDTLKPDRRRPRFLTRLVFPAGGSWSYRGSTSERASGGDSIVYDCSRARCLRSDPRGERGDEDFEV